LRLEEAELKIARGFGNNRPTPEQREKALVALVEGLKPGVWLVIEHPALDTPEMRNIGHKGYENVAADRAGAMRAFTSPAVKAAIDRRHIKLISYADLPSSPSQPKDGRDRSRSEHSGDCKFNRGYQRR
jgi:hypothetical protein